MQYDLKVSEYFYESGSDYIKLGEIPNMIYSGKVRCEYVDEKGTYYNYLLLPENELIVK